MMIAALLALACGAAAGIYLATRHFLRRRMSAWVALLHGVGGATGFTLVLVTVVQQPSFVPIRNVLYLLVATVVLGCVNLLFHVRRVRHRTSLILLHGFIAVSAAGTLIHAIAVHEPRPANPPAPTPPPLDSPQPVPLAAMDPKPSAPLAGPSAPDAVQQAFTRTIRFQTGRSDVDRAAGPWLDELSQVLRAHSEVTLVEVRGHADRRGHEQRNDELTRARATAVIDALAARGISRSRLRGAGYGSRCPADAACRDDESDAACKSAARFERDRRVELVVVEVNGRALERSGACESDLAATRPSPATVAFSGRK